MKKILHFFVMAVIGLLAITACEKTEAPDFVEDSEAEKLPQKLETYQQKMERRRLRQEVVRQEQELQKAQEKLSIRGILSDVPK